MGSIRVKWQAASIAGEMLNLNQVEMSSIIASIRSVKSNQCMKGENFTAIYKALDKVVSDLEEQKTDIKNLRDGLSEVLRTYDTYENRISGQIKGGTSGEANAAVSGSDVLFATIKAILGNMKIAASWGNAIKYFGTGIGTGTICKSFASIGVKWGKALSGVVQGIFGSIGIPDNATAPSYNLPEYALKDLDPVNGVYGPYVLWKGGGYGSVSYYNDPPNNTELSCTYYTLRKLNERGVSYPCVGGPGNGSQWYANFDTETELPRFGGNNALQDMANSLKMPQENIVVSFAAGNNDKWGHVLLIDSMYKDENGTVMVTWSDQYPKISDINGSNPAKTVALDEFIRKYSNKTYYGDMNGAVVIGAGRK